MLQEVHSPFACRAAHLNDAQPPPQGTPRSQPPTDDPTLTPAAQLERSAAAQTTGLSCPHCGGVLAAGWSSGHAGRCPTCRLMIGAGRGRPARSAPPGSAANLLANRARRADAAPEDPREVGLALVRAAVTLGGDPARMRMTDYLNLSTENPSLPTLEVVLATFSTWKAARAYGSRQHREVEG